MNDEDRHWFTLIDYTLGLFQLLIAAVVFVLIIYCIDIFGDLF